MTPTPDWRKDIERLKVKLAEQIHPTGAWAVQALWEDVEPDIISFIEKVESSAIKRTVKEVREHVQSIHDAINEDVDFAREQGGLCATNGLAKAKEVLRLLQSPTE